MMNWITHTFSQYVKDKSGSFTVFWALTLSTILMLVGAAYDMNAATTAKAKAQNFADTIALTAAINVKANDGLPQSDAEGYVHNKTYNLAELGFDIDPYIKMDVAQARENWAKVTYDEDAGQLTAVITGNSKTPFMSIFGVSAIPFTSSATVDYAVDDINNSLSLAMVLDISGSMYFYDETGTKRIDAMQAAAIKLMQDLETLVAGQENNGRILRTGMLPYWSYIWWPDVVNMKWGRVSDDQINALWEGGGTNSRDAMELADTWMQSESSFHENETGRTDARKYVILMTDGVNNEIYYDTQTLAACTSMKDAGVTIYTIGYALNLQIYSSETGHISDTTFEDITRARNMLAECASSSAHFKTTDNDTDIDEIFENIGAEIAAQFLRISH